MECGERSGEDAWDEGQSSSGPCCSCLLGELGDDGGVERVRPRVVWSAGGEEDRGEGAGAAVELELDGTEY